MAGEVPLQGAAGGRSWQGPHLQSFLLPGEIHPAGGRDEKAGDHLLRAGKWYLCSHLPLGYKWTTLFLLQYL